LKGATARHKDIFISNTLPYHMNQLTKSGMIIGTNRSKYLACVSQFYGPLSNIKFD